MVVKQTKAKNAAVRYFARKHNLTKIKTGNKQIYVFSKQEYRLFLFYINRRKEKKENKKQLVFGFYKKAKPAAQKKEAVKTKDEKKEKELLKKICTLLKAAKDDGVDKDVLIKKLKTDKKTLNRIINKAVDLPIAEDEEIDKRIYWIG